MGRLLLALVAASAAACTRTVADTGQTCELNSDCRPPLVCAASTCRPQCRTDRDCARGESCATYGTTGVCVPPASAVPCTYTSDCGAGRTCVDGTCRASCASDADCGGGTCARGGCSAPVTTGGDADASVPPADGCAGTTCGARCVDLTSDDAHCGACGNACALGSACRGGTCVACDADAGCPAPNDDCLSATDVVLAGPRTVVEVSPAGWSDSPGSCDATPDAFFRFHLAERSAVSVRVVARGAGSLNVGLVVACGGSVSCAAAACPSGPAVDALLDAGDHVFVVDATDLSLPVVAEVDVVPVGATTAVDRLGVDVLGAATASATLSAGDGTVPGGCTTGPTHVWFWSDCVDTPELDATACSDGARVRVGVLDGASGTFACNAGGSTCPPGSVESATVTAGALRVVAVSGETAADTGVVTLGIARR